MIISSKTWNDATALLQFLNNPQQCKVAEQIVENKFGLNLTRCCNFLSNRKFCLIECNRGDFFILDCNMPRLRRPWSIHRIAHCYFLCTQFVISDITWQGMIKFKSINTVWKEQFSPVPLAEWELCLGGSRFESCWFHNNKITFTFPNGIASCRFISPKEYVCASDCKLDHEWHWLPLSASLSTPDFMNGFPDSHLHS